ncbi:MAG: hypothetical protein PHP25_00860 [Candidatus Moranbacteria bacterium]|nr:hypothetical protein [Candidatus Moranbacteria bacterium]
MIAGRVRFHEQEQNGRISGTKPPEYTAFYFTKNIVTKAQLWDILPENNDRLIACFSFLAALLK